MRKPQNAERIVGRIYQHDLSVKTVQNHESANYGNEFIAGNLEVATDDAMLNVIKVHFTYVTPTTKSGTENKTYTVLKRIIDENKTITSVGADDALKVRIDTALALNDFYNANDELVSAKTNEGGFVTIISDLGEEKERNTFTADMLITGVNHVDADSEKNIEEHVSVRGAIFNFRNDLLPVEFSVKNADGMKYFEGLGATNAEPIYTKVWGRIESMTTTTTKEVESAFGEAAVRTFKNVSKDWVITGTAKEVYDFGDENVLTPAEVQKAAQDREVYLADVKKRNDEYKASKASSTPATATVAATATKTTGFSF